jgi:hypothetical protein
MLPQNKFKIFKVTIISVHAPAEDKVYTVISSLYGTLDRVCQTITEHDAVIVMGDMNAKVGDVSLTPYTGKYRLYKISNYNVVNL